MNESVVDQRPIDSDESVCQSIVTAVANLEDTAPTDLPVLAEVIDTDALEALIQSTAQRTPQVVFGYAGYRIVVTGGRTVILVSADTDSVAATLGPFGECAHCGAQLEADFDYPVVTDDQTDSVTFYAFCSRHCRTDWNANH